MTEIERHIDTIEKLIPEIEMGMNLFSYERSALQAALQALRRTAEYDKAREEGPIQPMTCTGCRYDQTDSLAEHKAHCMKCIRNQYPDDRYTRQEAESTLGGGEGG